MEIEVVTRGKVNEIRSSDCDAKILWFNIFPCGDLSSKDYDHVHRFFLNPEPRVQVRLSHIESETLSRENIWHRATLSAEVLHVLVHGTDECVYIRMNEAPFLHMDQSIITITRIRTRTDKIYISDRSNFHYRVWRKQRRLEKSLWWLHAAKCLLRSIFIEFRCKPSSSYMRLSVLAPPLHNAQIKPGMNRVYA